MNLNKNIVLIGMMGSGKSTLLKRKIAPRNKTKVKPNFKIAP